MALLNFKKSAGPVPGRVSPDVETFLQGYSIEVMPRTAAKVDNFADILPAGTRVYIAHIEGTPIEDMVATAKRLNGEGFDVMPHFPARIIKDTATLTDWIARYQGEANVHQALLLAGGVTTPHGDLKAPCNCWKPVPLTKQASPISTLQVTPKATKTSTLTVL